VKRPSAKDGRMPENDGRPTKLTSFGIYWLPLILYALLIYLQSAKPTPEQIPSLPLIDKLLHFVAYGIMGILFYRAYQTLRFKDNLAMMMLLSVVSASVYGISDELHQHFVPFREADFMDVIADTLGALCGVALYQWRAISRRDRKVQ
jgi:VanZ family protein